VGPGELRLSTGWFSSEGQSFQVESPTAQLHLELSTPLRTTPGESTSITITATDALGNPAAAEITLAAADEAVLRLLGSIKPTTIKFEETQRFAEANPAQSPGLDERLRFSLVDRRPGTFVRARGGISVDGAPAEPLTTIEVSAVDHTYYGAIDRRIASGSKYQISGFVDRESSLSASRISVPSNSQNGDVSARIRTHFASTATWQPTLRTGNDGKVTTEITWPDNLTAWHLTAYAAHADGKSFATQNATVRSSLPFQTRLQTPRFLIDGDTLAPSVVLVNQTDALIDATASMTFEGPIESISEDPTSDRNRNIEVPATNETTAFWSIRATSPGEATITAVAGDTDNADAMRIEFPVFEDGIPQKTAASLRLLADQSSGTLELPLPDPLDSARAEASLKLSTSPAIAALDALPYLIDFPYGCVEQTVNRFVPAMIVQDALLRLGLDAAEVESRIMRRFESSADPLRQRPANLGKFEDVIIQSIARLAQSQQPNGGFGWWSGSATTDHWMTAYVGWSLGLAQAAGIEIPSALYQSTINQCWQLIHDSSVDDEERVWLILACATSEKFRKDSNLVAETNELFSRRKHLNGSSTRAALALALAAIGSPEQKAIITRNLENAVIRETSDLGELVHWGTARGFRNALNGANETTALTVLCADETGTGSPPD